jgi:hypothetical protein
VFEKEGNIQRGPKVLESILKFEYFKN